MIDYTDLMIGDWVLIGGNIERVTASNLFDMERNYKAGGTNWCEPIPLTDEIMLLNGFEKTEWNDILVGKYYDTYLQPNWCAKQLDVRHVFNVGWFLYGLRDIPVNHVHELQHALRLCGLKGLANNFKIK